MESFLAWGLAAFLFVHVVLASSQLEQKQKLCTDDHEQQLHIKTFRSEAFTLGPGDVQDKYYLMEFPTGHIAIRSFFAEVVDEQGISVPLHEIYLHHWVVVNLYVKQSEKEAFIREGYHRQSSLSTIMAGNDGVCPNKALAQIFGLGSETRHTNTTIPSPYGIVVGDPQKAPEGFEELWEVNIHAIDTRGVEDRQGCTECRCDLYNVTRGRDGKPLRDYPGGLRCCRDGAHCRVKEGFQAERKKLYLQYTVQWVDWDVCVVPVKVYIFDVTDARDGKGCRTEYNIPLCSSVGFTSDCIDTRESHVASPQNGHVIYGVAHQHSGGKGSILYGEDGREICASVPLYGSGTVAGDEAGYIVGMTSCYPKPNSINIKNKEILRLQSNHSMQQSHTGVMGLFYLLVASLEDEASTSKEGLSSYSSNSNPTLVRIVSGCTRSNIVLVTILLVGVASVVAFVVAKRMRNRSASHYEALAS